MERLHDNPILNVLLWIGMIVGTFILTIIGTATTLYPIYWLFFS